MSVKSKVIIPAVFLVLFIFFTGSVNATTTVTLNNPQNGAVFTAANNVTFNCSVTSDNYIRWLSLYHNMSGSFVLNQTEYFGELGPDNSTVLLMHFNNESSAGENDTHVYDWSGSGNNGTVQNAAFNSSGGKFLGAFEFDGTGDYMEIRDSDSLDIVNGTIEMWIKADDISGKKPILIKEPGCGEEGQLTSPYAVYVENGHIKLILNNYPDYYKEVQSSSAINPGSWYHLAFIWNGTDEYNLTEVNIYIDGTLDKAEMKLSTISANNYNLQIGRYGSSCSEQSYFNGSIDELAIYNRPLSADEIQSHYNKQLMKNTSANWTISNITDGAYKWNCLAYDNSSQNNWAASNATFYVDISSPPSVETITLSPSSLDDLDPGITINVTANILDPSNVSAAVFQYKEYLSSPNWTNNTMSNNTDNGVWNTSFTTTSSGDRTYYYRIWSNDTLGRSGYSATYNISVAKDYTWTINTSDLGIETGKIGTVGQLGILVVNNTGDDNISFTLNDDWYLDVDYNGSNGPYQFSIGPKSIMSINITALFEDYTNEKNFTINISATPFTEGKTAAPQNRSISILMNSYTGGPYFNVYIVSPPTYVNQSQAFNLTARIKNIGNETANSTFFNWTLPIGWSLVSGNISNNLGNITSGETKLNNLTITINPSTGSVGTYRIYVNATCDQGINGSDSAVIGVQCSNDDGVCGSGCSYVNDDDCSLPGGGTAGGTTLTAISGISKEYKIELAVPSRLDINRGESKALRIGVINNISGTKLANIYLSLSGYPQTFLSYSPYKIDEIAYGETKYFDVEVRAPVYAVYNEYYLNATVAGKFVEASENKSAEKSARIFVVTHKFIENETIGYLGKAEVAMNEMAKVGFETKQISGLVEEIKKALDDGNYDRVRELSEDVMSIRESAFKLSEQIKETEENIAEMKGQSISLPESERMLFLAKAAFQRGDYKMAEGRISGAMLVYAVETGNSGVLIFINKYWWFISAAVVFCSLMVVLGKRRIARLSLTKDLYYLGEEEKKTYELIETLQKEHFIERKMGTESYLRDVENYEKGLAEIRKKRTDILSKTIKMMKASDALKKLKEEEGRVRRMITEMQDKYFRQGKMGKSRYEKTVGDLKAELVEIERLAETLRSGKNA